MSSTTTRPTDESTKPSLTTVSLSVSREQLVLAVIVVVQATWLGFVMLRGWYSAADLPNLAFANGRSLDWDYLTSDLGGHFGVAQRLVYWVLNRAAPLEWWLTVLIRVAFQALTTVLLWRLFRTLVGPRPWLWIVLAAYAFSAYLVPGMAALNSGLGLGIAQACLVGALLAQVRYTRERRLIDAAQVAVLVLIMLSFAQQSLPTIVFLPLLSLVFLRHGSVRERAHAELRSWRGWLLIAAALLAFAALYLRGDYNSPSSDFTLRDGLWLCGRAWLEILGPALVGGPWDFYAWPEQWSAYAVPPVALLVLGQVALVGLIVLSVRRIGWLALVAWFIPVWTAATGLILVGLGRWSVIGELLPSTLRYSYFVPLTLALGIVLAFGAGSPAARPGARIADRWLDARRRRVLVGVSVTLLLATSCFSTLRFAARFWENPARDYTQALLGDAKELGSTVPLFDTRLPEGIAPYLSRMYVSDLMALGGASADFELQSGDRRVVDPDGNLVLAKFVKTADFSRLGKPGCGIYVGGVGTTRFQLSRVDGLKEWFLQLELYQPHPNRVTMRVFDEEGEELSITSGSPILDTQGELVVLHRRIETGVPAVIELESTDRDTSLCLVHTYVGVPLP